MTQAELAIATSEEVREGEMLARRIGKTRVLLARLQGRVCAVVDRCPHMGMSLAKGALQDGVVTCPWHNSRFEFCTGRNLDWVNAIRGIPMPGWTHQLLAMGKAPAPLTTLAVSEREGSILVDVPPG